MCAEKREIDRCTRIERSIITKYEKTIWHRFIAACKAYSLVQRDDKVAVCISGGKDSFLLAKCLQELQHHSEVPFTLDFICMDPGYNAENRAKIEENAQLMNIPVHFFHTDVFDVAAMAKKGNPCYLCARMRRGYLYKEAQDRGCNKIALGHHFDDIIETTLISMMYGAECKTMLPKLNSENYENMQLIRPLAFVHEKDIMAWRRYNDLQFIQCACRFTENAPPDAAGTGARQQVKELVTQLRKVNPQIDVNIYRAMEHVNLNMVLGWQHNGETHSFMDEL